jgi:SAM-dependent methyltransferase
MGFYADHVLPRLVHLSLKGRPFSQERARALADVSGDVLELGIGSGLNLPHYPSGVRSVVGIEPSATAARLATPAIAQVDFPVEIRRGEAEAADDQARFDAVVSTYTLCTIGDPGKALERARRALRPGGKLYFLEHGLAPAAGVQKWQRRLEPLHRRLAGGCHLTRDPRELIEAAGFTIDRIETHYGEGPRVWSFMYSGAASPR